MKRFMGLMPFNEIEISKVFKTELEDKVKIDSGKNGWTIIYSDYSTEYKDKVDTPENNLKEALRVLEKHFKVTEI